MSPLCAQKLARLKTIVAERSAWADQVAQIKRLHSWLLEVEHILDESLAAAGEVVSNATVVAASARRKMTFMETPASVLLLLQPVLGRAGCTVPPKVDDGTGLAACKRHGPRQKLHRRVAQMRAGAGD